MLVWVCSIYNDLGDVCGSHYKLIKNEYYEIGKFKRSGIVSTMQRGS